MPLFHVVVVAFPEGTSEEKKNELTEGFQALTTKCVKPDTGKPYIRSFKTGSKNISIEGFEKHWERIYILEFDSVADRDHYVKEDPEHREFATAAKEKLSDLFIYDFEA